MKHDVTGYVSHRCRCDVCRAAWATYIREWRAAKPERGARHRAANRAYYQRKKASTQ